MAVKDVTLLEDLEPREIRGDDASNEVEPLPPTTRH